MDAGRNEVRCATRYCLGTPQMGRKFCQKCRSRQWRKQNPLRTSYLQKKRNAWLHDVEFNLTFEQWREFCEQTNYLKLRGPEGHHMTVGRKNHYKGYEVGNIKLQTRSDNAKEGKSGKPPKYVKQPGDPF